MESQFWIPTISDDGRQLDVYSSMLSDGIIFVNAPIDQRIAGLINSCLLKITAASGERRQPKVYLNTRKGDVLAAMSIVDIIELCQKRSLNVETLAFGEVGVAASLILAAGAKGLRRAAEHCQISLYVGREQLEFESLDSSQAKATQAERTRTMVVELFARYSSSTVDEYRVRTNNESYLSSQDAVGLGLVDAVI